MRALLLLRATFLVMTLVNIAVSTTLVVKTRQTRRDTAEMTAQCNAMSQILKPTVPMTALNGFHIWGCFGTMPLKDIPDTQEPKL